MSEQLTLITGSKTEKYETLLPQIKALIAGEDDLIANLANVSAALKAAFDFFWVGFYLVKDKELVLGPFQGSIACTRIGYGRGVCGTAWQKGSNFFKFFAFNKMYIICFFFYLFEVLWEIVLGSYQKFYQVLLRLLLYHS